MTTCEWGDCDGGFHGDECSLPARYILVRNPGIDAQVEMCCKPHAEYVLRRKHIGEMPDVEIYLPSGGDPLVLGLWPRKDRP